MAHCIILLESVLLKVVSAAWNTSVDLTDPPGPRSTQRKVAQHEAGPCRAPGWFLLHLSQFREPERTISRKRDDAFVARYCAKKADLWQRAATGCEHGCSCEEATAPAARLLSSVILCMSAPAELLETPRPSGAKWPEQNALKSSHCHDNHGCSYVIT